MDSIQEIKEIQDAKSSFMPRLEVPELVEGRVMHEDQQAYTGDDSLNMAANEMSWHSIISEFLFNYSKLLRCYLFQAGTQKSVFVFQDIRVIFHETFGT